MSDFHHNLLAVYIFPARRDHELINKVIPIFYTPFLALNKFPLHPLSSSNSHHSLIFPLPGAAHTLA